MTDNGTAPAPVFQTMSGGKPTGQQACTGQADENPAFSPQADAITYDRPGPNSQDVYDAYTVSIEDETTATGSQDDLTPNYTTDEEPNWGPLQVGTNVPEAPFTLALPIAGAALLGVSVLVRRRRQVAP
jgi:hypothetical protein